MKLSGEKQTFIGVLLAILIVLFIIMLALNAKGCGKAENQPPAASNPSTQNAPAPTEVDGKAVYAKYCAICHGPEGKGDGVASGGQARNFTNKKEWKTYGDDEKTYKIIAEGGPAVLGPMSGMPPFGNSLSKEEIKAVMNHVKSLAK